MVDKKLSKEFRKLMQQQVFRKGMNLVTKEIDDEITIIHKEQPISTQHIYGYRSLGRKGVIKYMLKNAKDWKAKFVETIREQLPDRFLPYAEVIHMDILFNFNNRRKHDIDNYCKLILDSMNELVYLDDNQIVSMNLFKTYVPEVEDAIIIKIKPVNTECE